MKPAARTALVVIAALIAMSIPAAQALTQFGMSAGEFSSGGDSTLRVAGYAFSIWGLIYIGMLTFGIYQALPATTESATLSPSPGHPLSLCPAAVSGSLPQP